MSATTRPSVYKGGVGAIERLMRRGLGLQLTEDQAAALWLECKARLAQVGLKATVRHVDTSDGGSLDTLERGDVLAAMAWVFTSGEQDWPLNGDTLATSNAFYEKVASVTKARGYQPIETEAA